MVFVENQLTVTFRPSTNILTGTIILFEAPPMTTSSSLQYFYSTALCTAVANFAAGANCVYNDVLRMIRITNAFPAQVASSETVSFKLGNIFSPVSTSQYVLSTYPKDGFKLSLLNAQERRYNREDNVKVRVTQPKLITDYIVNLPNNTVGNQGKLFQTITFNAPVLANSVLKLTHTRIGTPVCVIFSSLNLESTNCQSLVLSAIDANQQIILILSNIVNNVHGSYSVPH